MGTFSVVKRPMEKVFDALVAAQREPRRIRNEDTGDELIIARSPLREDHHPSLRITEAADGSVLMYDGPGHAYLGSRIALVKATCQKLGLTLNDLRPLGTRRRGKGSDATSIRDVEPLSELSSRVDPYAACLGATLTARYTYHDEAGGILFEQQRYTFKDKRKTFRPRRPIGDGIWVRTLGRCRTPSGGVFPPVRYVLYGLPQIQTATPEIPVIVVEGEKDVDRLRIEGLLATTNPNGAGNWRLVRDHAMLKLAGRPVVIIPDNDAPGRKHTLDVAASLVNVAEEVRIVQLPGLEPKGDVSDWLDAGHTVAELNALIAQAEPIQIQPADLGLTDLGNARRFTSDHQEAVRYCHVSGQWYYWSEIRWETDTSGEIMRKAKHTADKLSQESEKGENKKVQAMRRNWAIQSKSLARLRAMLELAKSERPIPIAAHNFDCNDWLLNCPNGTLDLRTHELRPHERADFITKVCQVEYRPDAKCDLWLAFLMRIFDGDDALIRFVQQFLGICLTGDISAQYLPIFYGEGNNGKNVLLDTVCAIHGEYASEAPPGLLEASQSERHPTEIMDLMGKRLVVSSETEHGKALRLQFIKRATGNATMKGRKMRQDFVEFRRTHKLILMTNNKPIIKEDTEATWRRVRLVPFTVVIPKSERDPKLIQKLKDEWQGILAWMIRGCLDWQQNGLIEPAVVETATAEYRKEENPVAQFVEQSCALGSYIPGEPDDVRYAVQATVLWQHYKLWCEKRGRFPHGDQLFSHMLRHAVPAVEKKTVRFGGKPTCSWIGLRLSRNNF